MVIVAHCRGGNCLVRIFQQRLASNILALFCVELLYPLEQVRSQNLILHVCCPVMKSCPTLWPRGLQHTRLPSPSPSPGACSNSCALSQWCHPTISSSVTPFSPCLQSFPTSGSFPMSRFFPTGGQCIGASASASVLPLIIQCYFLPSLPGMIPWALKGHTHTYNWKKWNLILW